MKHRYEVAFDYMNEIYEYDFSADESDSVAQKKIELDLLCMLAIDKQIPKKPIRIHEIHPKHDWMLDKNGEIDLWAMSVGYCNGPVCKRCYTSVCEICNPDYNEEECEVDEMHCPSCNEKIDWPYEKNKFCRNCGQAIDWSN